ncbi:DUF2652 domain-containing protein [Chitinophaga caseinilytica]|uniref:DUF2652 domain-containing protein n=1 Tax=Chitinophaga caseinilytica TaxID=2267521 RepID=A0ABZ2YY78_9BACT
MRTSILPKRNPVHRSHGTQARKGLVFIPDMSGFTALVRSTDLITGQIITCELLAVILQHNTLGMEIAEIEGDAVFFYKWDAIPAMEALYAQFEAMKAAFDAKLRELEAQFGLQLDLHLKAIAHYGDMTEFSVGAYHKLYGEVVVEAHRLLKNNVPARSYLLVTDALQPLQTGSLTAAGRSSQLCELYGGLRGLCFTYILFNRRQQKRHSI